jgi:hypothetical protein
LGFRHRGLHPESDSPVENGGWVVGVIEVCATGEQWEEGVYIESPGGGLTERGAQGGAGRTAVDPFLFAEAQT